MFKLENYIINYNALLFQNSFYNRLFPILFRHNRRMHNSMLEKVKEMVLQEILYWINVKHSIMIIVL